MSVIKRGKVYYARFKIRGKSFFRSTEKTTKAEAVVRESQIRAEVLAELDKPVLMDLSLIDAANKMYELEWYAKSTGTEMLNKIIFLANTFGNVMLSEVSPRYITEIREGLLKDGLVGATVNRYLAHLRTIMRKAAYEWELDCRVPQFPMYKESEGRIRVISKEEEVSILGLLKSQTGTRQKHFPVLAEYIEVLLDTGLRASEALKLEWDRHVSLDRRTITVSPDITKSGRYRTVPMTNRVKRIMEQRRGVSDTPFPYTIWQVEAVWRFLRKKLSIHDDEFCVHACRHTCATRLVRAGVDLYRIKTLLGHSSIKVTERYARLGESNLQDAVNCLE